MISLQSSTRIIAVPTEMASNDRDKISGSDDQANGQKLGAGSVERDKGCLILEKLGPRPAWPKKSLLLWEVIFTNTFPIDICSAAMQATAKSIGVAQINLNNLHA